MALRPDHLREADTASLILPRVVTGISLCTYDPGGWVAAEFPVAQV